MSSRRKKWNSNGIRRHARLVFRPFKKTNLKKLNDYDNYN